MHLTKGGDDGDEAVVELLELDLPGARARARVRARVRVRVRARLRVRGHLELAEQIRVQRGEQRLASARVAVQHEVQRALRRVVAALLG